MSAPTLRFGVFELDVAGYELRRSGRPIKVERLAMELLMLLVERSGQLVTRDKILERLWGKDVFLDFDNSINTAISKVRAALRDNPENPAFIKTIPGKGYRFIASVTVSDGAAETTSPSTASSTTRSDSVSREGSSDVPSQATTVPRPRRFWLWPFVVGVTVAAAFGVWMSQGRSSPT